MDKVSLYEITADMEQLMEMLEDPECDCSDECLRDTFEGLEGMLDDKVNVYCKLIKMYTNQAKAIKEEKERLQKRQTAAEKSAQRLKSILVQCLSRLGKEKYKTGMFTIYSFNFKKLSKYSTTDVPDIYKIEKTSMQVDENALKAALDANGGNLGFVHYIENCTIR